MVSIHKAICRIHAMTICLWVVFFAIVMTKLLISSLDTYASVPQVEYSLHKKTDDIKKQIEENINVLNHKASRNKPTNIHGDEYLHVPRLCCETTTLLVLVRSAAKDFERRMMLRASWAEIKRHKFISFTFLLAQEPSIQPLVDYEAKIFGDIVQDIITEYPKTKRKTFVNTISGLQWFVHHCPMAKYILFLDKEKPLDFNDILGYLQSNEDNNVINFEEEYNLLPCGFWHLLTYLKYPFQKDRDNHNVKTFAMKNYVAKKFTTAYSYISYNAMTEDYFVKVANILNVTLISRKIPRLCNSQVLH